MMLSNLTHQMGGVWCRDPRVDRACFALTVKERHIQKYVFQVQRNSSNILPGEDDWGFGQIIALILIFGSVIDIVVTVRERWKGGSSEDSGSRVGCHPRPAIPLTSV